MVFLLHIQITAPDADFTKEQLWRALAHEVDVDGKLSCKSI